MVLYEIWASYPCWAKAGFPLHSRHFFTFYNFLPLCNAQIRPVYWHCSQICSELSSNYLSLCWIDFNTRLSRWPMLLRQHQCSANSPASGDNLVALFLSSLFWFLIFSDCLVICYTWKFHQPKPFSNSQPSIPRFCSKMSDLSHSVFWFFGTVKL